MEEKITSEEALASLKNRLRASDRPAPVIRRALEDVEQLPREHQVLALALYVHLWIGPSPVELQPLIAVGLLPQDSHGRLPRLALALDAERADEMRRHIADAADLNFLTALAERELDARRYGRLGDAEIRNMRSAHKRWRVLKEIKRSGFKAGGEHNGNE